MADRNQVAQALLSNYTPSWREKIGNSIYDVARALMPSTANRMRDEAMMAVDFIPGVGEAVGLNDAYNDFNAGNYGSAAFNAGTSLVGAVPGAGDLAAGVAKAVFGGIAAKTADRATLETAQQLAATGADKQAIWDATGWFQGPDGQWRFEIDDSGSTLNQTHVALGGASPETSAPMSNVLQHSPLYDAYPDLGNIPASMRMDAVPLDGTYHAPRTVGNRVIEGISGEASTPRDLRSVAHHELQHAIQHREGFAQGGSPGQMGVPQDELWDAARRAYLDSDQDAAILRQLGIDVPDTKLKPWEDLSRREQVEWLERGRQNIYHRLGGEVEARNVQTRMDMTPQQRRATPPWETQDVPDELQIVRRR